MKVHRKAWILAVVIGVALATSALAAGDDPPPVIGAPAVGGTIPLSPGTGAPGDASGERAPTCDDVTASYGQAVVRCEQALMQATEELALARAEGAARAQLVTLAPVERADLPGGREHVAHIVKGMKPRDAAAMVAQWDESLGADILARLSPKVSAPVLAAMPPATSARITARIAERSR